MNVHEMSNVGFAASLNITRHDFLQMARLLRLRADVGPVSV
jgi:hypothetical protein